MTGEILVEVLKSVNGDTHSILTETKEIAVSTYSDGMPIVKWDEASRRVTTMLLRPQSLSAFMTAMFLVDAWADRGVFPPHLILPAMPGARQDRLNDTGDYLFTAKSVARELNLRKLPSVTLVDPHSDVSAALVDRSRVIHAAECINPPAGKYAAVVSPDAGAEKRAAAVAKKLGVPLIHAWKTRDVATGAISGFGMQTPPLDEKLGAKDAIVLVVDDLCDGGGTFIGLAGAIKPYGFKAHLWTTHGLYSKGTAELLQHYGHLYCTDSVLGPREGVIEIGVCKKLLTEGSL